MDQATKAKFDAMISAGVKMDDHAYGYALPYIGAIKAAGITEGNGDGTFDPAGKVTKEQLATFLYEVWAKIPR
ncbi:S-layer family protein [Paenibacillus methanolicus]|uniref:S-layer family protein n=1 Tax=Paenibacillus methanolicus TaxID=582686 RepID=A0A5S5BXM0_9BACL|nr:S-layer family protein [Paenibacillus methanolicus]